MRRLRHLQLIQLEKQRLDYIKNFNNQFQMEAFKFMLEYKQKSTKKLVVGIVAITGSLFFGYYNIISEIIGGIIL